MKSNFSRDTANNHHHKGLSTSLKKSAVAGAIWIISEQQKDTSSDGGHSDGDRIVELISTVAKSFHITTIYRNIKEISELEYNYLISVPHDQRLPFLMENDGTFFQDLLNIKIYDKVTVLVSAQHNKEEHHLRDCIVHYIGAVRTKKGYFFGVVFEVGDKGLRPKMQLRTDLIVVLFHKTSSIKPR